MSEAGRFNLTIMTTLDKINRCHDLIVEANKRVDAQLENTQTWHRDSFYTKQDCYNKIASLRAAQERVINYMRKQTMNLIVELGS